MLSYLLLIYYIILLVYFNCCYGYDTSHDICYYCVPDTLNNNIGYKVQFLGTLIFFNADFVSDVYFTTSPLLDR